MSYSNKFVIINEKTNSVVTVHGEVHFVTHAIALHKLSQCDQKKDCKIISMSVLESKPSKIEDFQRET